MTVRSLLAQWHNAQLHIDALSADLDKPEHALTPTDHQRLTDERDSWHVAQAGIEAELAAGSG